MCIIIEALATDWPLHLVNQLLSSYLPVFAQGVGVFGSFGDERLVFGLSDLVCHPLGDFGLADC